MLWRIVMRDIVRQAIGEARAAGVPAACMGDVMGLSARTVANLARPSGDRSITGESLLALLADGGPLPEAVRCRAMGRLVRELGGSVIFAADPDGVDGPRDMSDQTVGLSAAVGDLAHAVTRSRSAESPLGARISDGEAELIGRAAGDVVMRSAAIGATARGDLM